MITVVVNAKARTVTLRIMFAGKCRTIVCHSTEEALRELDRVIKERLEAG